MKTCIQCGEGKPLEEFYKHPRMADGHLGKCKSCCKAYQMARQEEKSKDPAWIEAEANRQRDKAARMRAEGRACPTNPEAKAAWRKRNPEKAAAHSAVSRALKKGTLKKGSCVDCGSPDDVNAHHEDYAKPLDVIWYCTKCHFKRHVEINRARRQGAEPPPPF